MPRYRPDSNRKFHNRIAHRYDAIYDDPFWDFHDRLTWAHLKAHLPTNPQANVLDLGCGTGKWGLRYLKLGYSVSFVDLSESMLSEVKTKLATWSEQPDMARHVARATLVQANALQLDALPEASFDLIVAMGDVVCLCGDPPSCLHQMVRVLRPGGIIAFTIDNLLAGLDHFTDSGDLDELIEFARTGKTKWLANREADQFEIQMLSPLRAEAMIRAQNLELVSRIGKTILPVRNNRKFFKDPKAIERLVEVEQLLGRDPAAIGRASHVQYVVRKPG